MQPSPSITPSITSSSKRHTRNIIRINPIKEFITRNLIRRSHPPEEDGRIGRKVLSNRKKVWVEKRGEKSFADAVRGHEWWEWKGLAFATQKMSLPWMMESVVGRYNAELNFEQLREEFVRRGMSMVRVRSMGDNLALLTPREGETMEDLTEWFDNVFVSL